MIAAQHGEVPPRVRIMSFFDVFNPGPVNTDGDIVFFFAGYGARMTADATVLVDEKSVAHLLQFKSEN